MEFISDVINLIGSLQDNSSGSRKISSLSLIPFVSIGLVIIVFISEIVLYILKKPKRLSDVVLIISIIGMFASLFMTLYQIQSPVKVINQELSDKFIASIFIGLLGGLLAIILTLLEKFFGVCDTKSLEKSVQKLIKTLNGQINSPSRLTHENSPNHTKDLMYISQQIFDLTNHIKQELDSNRQNDDRNTEKLIQSIHRVKQEGSEPDNKTHHAVLGPKIVAKMSSAISQSEPSNDSTFHEVNT